MVNVGSKNIKENIDKKYKQHRFWGKMHKFTNYKGVIRSKILIKLNYTIVDDKKTQNLIKLIDSFVKISSACKTPFIVVSILE